MKPKDYDTLYLEEYARLIEAGIDSDEARIMAQENIEAGTCNFY